MKMESMYKLEDMCCKEIDRIVQRGDLSSSTLQQAGMLVDIVKDVYTIEAMCDDDNEYSEYGGTYSRDSRGRYSRDGYSRRSMSNTGVPGGVYSRGRYSRDGDKDDMIRRMERMMEQSNDPNEINAYQRAMDQLRNA